MKEDNAQLCFNLDYQQAKHHAIFFAITLSPEDLLITNFLK